MQIIKRSGHQETELQLKEGVKGYYTLIIKDAATGDVKREIGPFANDLTLLGLNRLGTSGDVLNRGYVGTGTNAPSNSDTSMGTFKVAHNSAADTFIAPQAPRWYATRVRTFTFNAGTINGNITEVGVGWTDTSVMGLWSRQLILDSNGLPVTLTVLENEILELVYALRYYPPGVEDFTGSFTLNAITYNYQARLARAASTQMLTGGSAGGPTMQECYAAGASLGSVTSTISGTTVPSGTISRLSYVDNSFKARAVTSFSLSQGNHASGIQAFQTALDQAGSRIFRSAAQFLLDKPIPKTNLNTMSFTMETSWGPYTGPL